MKRAVFFITGTDTGAGKTVLAALLTRHLRAAGRPAVALKPVCSGGRGDARRLRAASAGRLTLEEINPWHFRAPLAPAIAARRENARVTLAQLLAQVRRIQQRFPVVVVEGAGGLLSPLGEDFDSRDLIRRLRARPIVVCPNRLGAINQVRLVLAALPRGLAGQAHIVLMSAARPDAAARSNPRFLSEEFGRRRVHLLPRLKFPDRFGRGPAGSAVRRILRALAQWK